MRILLVEDDELIGRGIAAGLQKHGIAVHHVGTAAEAEATHSEDTFNALVLDLGLPDRDGMELLASMRAVEPQLPVLILTARDAIEHRLKGLHEGADDYMVKPFDLRELAAADPAAGHEGVDLAGDALAVHPGGGGGAREGLAVGVQPLAVAVPLVGLHGEGVGGVRGALMMAMDLKGEE